MKKLNSYLMRDLSIYILLFIGCFFCMVGVCVLTLSIDPPTWLVFFFGAAFAVCFAQIYDTLCYFLTKKEEPLEEDMEEEEI